MCVRAWNARCENGNPGALPAAKIARSRLTEVEAELRKSHDNFCCLAFQVDRVNRDFECLTAFDFLTGLANRTLFYDQLGGFIAITRRESRKLSLLLCDISALRVINGSLGHKAGDHVLKEVVVRISEVVRYSDTAPRLGGDKFVIV